MEYNTILNRISEEYISILKDNLIGLYVHGSLAFGCFNPRKSDIDFLVVVKNVPTLDEKEKLINVLIELSPMTPPKGLEMSVVRNDICKNFVYPTPFELHFSNTHLERCQENLKEYCETMNGTDKDLAAHFTVVKNAGIVLCGKAIEEVFGNVQKEYFLDSIKYDIENAKEEIYKNPVYIILNLCRVLAYMSESLILSKEQGGLWGGAHLPPRFAPLIQTALKCYQSDENHFFEEPLSLDFCNYMYKRIFANL